jgi:hypothetical protein
VASVDVKPQVGIPLSNKFFLADSRARTFLLGALLVVITVALYAPVHSHPFFNLDDYFDVADNVHVHHGLDWETIKWSFTAMNMANWIPLSWLSHAIDYQMFGRNPAGHHDMNVFFHALDVVLLFWVLKRATGYTGRSFMVAALFAVHPMNVEAVAWIAERRSVLSMVFFLLALGAYRWYARNPTDRRYTVIALLFALGLLAKPQVITLPFVLLLWDYWPLQRMFPNAPSSSPQPEPGIFPPQTLSQLIKEKIPLLFLVRRRRDIHGFGSGFSSSGPYAAFVVTPEECRVLLCFVYQEGILAIGHGSGATPSRRLADALAGDRVCRGFAGNHRAGAGGPAVSLSAGRMVLVPGNAGTYDRNSPSR